MTAPLTVDDRELIERLRIGANVNCELRLVVDASKAADRLQSLLSERDKLREALNAIITGDQSVI